MSPSDLLEKTPQQFKQSFETPAPPRARSLAGGDRKNMRRRGSRNNVEREAGISPFSLHRERAQTLTTRRRAWGGSRHLLVRIEPASGHLLLHYLSQVSNISSKIFLSRSRDRPGAGCLASGGGGPAKQELNPQKVSEGTRRVLVVGPFA